MEENRTEEMNNDAAAGGMEEDEAGAAVAKEPEQRDPDEAMEEVGSEREAYEELIKTRFRFFYAEDTQKLINRRFRKYKVMEERYKLMEEKLSAQEQELAVRDKQIEALKAQLEKDVALAVKNTEDRVVRQIRSKQNRPVENGLLADKYVPGFRSSTANLTREEREQMARRAFNGETVSF